MPWFSKKAPGNGLPLHHHTMEILVLREIFMHQRAYGRGAKTSWLLATSGLTSLSKKGLLDGLVDKGRLRPSSCGTLKDPRWWVTGEGLNAMHA